MNKPNEKIEKRKIINQKSVLFHIRNFINSKLQPWYFFTQDGSFLNHKSACMSSMPNKKMFDMPTPVSQPNSRL